jgi:hypothetical protein
VRARLGFVVKGAAATEEVLKVLKVPAVLKVLFGACIAVVVATAGLAAQWKTPNKPGALRTEIDSGGSAPRTAEGKPDFSGIWAPGAPPGTSVTGNGVQPVRYPSLPPGVSRATPNNIGLDVAKTDEALAIIKARADRFFRDNPRSQCQPMGIMQLHTQAVPVKIIQTSSQLVLLYEANFERREIFMDGRVYPGPNAQPFFNGYSAGHWDGDTLVVETQGFRDRGWLDATGTPISHTAMITERFRRPSLGLLEIDVRIDDAKTFLRPVNVRVSYSLRPDDELIELVCLENQKFGPDPGTDRSAPGSLITPR